MMNESATTERILTFVRSTFASRLRQAGELEPSSPLFSNRLVDSMGIVELLSFLEHECKVSINTTIEELMELDTAANLARLIAELQRAQRR